MLHTVTLNIRQLIVKYIVQLLYTDGSASYLSRVEVSQSLLVNFNKLLSASVLLMCLTDGYSFFYFTDNRKSRDKTKLFIQ